MTGLAIKEVQFNGATLRAAQDAENIIWVGVRWVCEGLGLSENRTDYERKRIQNDLVLSKGVKFYSLGNDRAKSDVLCLKLDFLPLWLAKISITPKMKKENPLLVENLIEYQLKAKDVLAVAFLKKEMVVPQSDYSKQISDLQNTIKEMRQENHRMYKDMKSLANIILDWKESYAHIPANDSYIVDKTYVYSQWKIDMYSKMDNICKNTYEFEKRADVMKYIYRYMNNNYGIVWEEEVSEYKKLNNIIYKPSTIDIVRDKQILRSIFGSILDDMERKYCFKNNQSMNWVDNIISPLIDLYNDNSNAGMTTYRKVYARMNKNNNISWKNLSTRYLKEYGRKPTKKDLVETRPSLQKKFKIAVNDLIKEVNKEERNNA